MQKSKGATLIIILIIVIYTILGITYLRPNVNDLYIYVINPIFWIILSVILLISLKKIYKRNLKKEVIQYTITTILIYIIVLLISGSFVSFGHNPYSTTIKGLLTNAWIFGIIIVAKEIIRYKLIDNVYEKDKINIGIIIVIVFSMIELCTNIAWISEPANGYYIFKQIATIVLPIIIKNILFTYMATNSNFVPAIIYELTIKLFLWISPILPNIPWIMSAVIELSLPTILFLYIRYIKNKKDIYKSKRDIIYLDPRSIIPTFVIIILAIWFAIGIFPIKPVAIATGSMNPNLKVGDIAIVIKCNRRRCKRK